MDNLTWSLILAGTIAGALWTVIVRDRYSDRQLDEMQDCWIAEMDRHAQTRGNLAALNAAHRELQAAFLAQGREQHSSPKQTRLEVRHAIAHDVPGSQPATRL